MYDTNPIYKLLYSCQQIESYIRLKSLTYGQAAMCMSHLRQCQDMADLIYYIPQVSFTIDWEKLMATKNDNFNLIDYRLSDQELSEFEAWFEEKAPNPTECLMTLAEKSIKVSLTYVENSQAWCVSLTGQKDAKFNSGSTLTTWADEPLEGLYMAYYKALYVFNGGVWKTKTQSRRG